MTYSEKHAYIKIKQQSMGKKVKKLTKKYSIKYKDLIIDEHILFINL